MKRSDCASAASAPTDNDVTWDGVLASVFDVGEGDGRAFDAMDVAQRDGATTIADKRIGAEVDGKAEALLSEPTDGFGAAEAGIGKEQRGNCFGEQASDQSAHAAFQSVLAMTQAVRVISAKGPGWGTCFARHGREKDRKGVQLGPVQCYGEELCPLPRGPI